MKQRFALLAGLAMIVAGGIAGTGHAAPVCTAAGCASVNEGGNAVVLDGDSGNPDPLDGYIIVTSDGHVCADDNGGPSDPDFQPNCYF